MGSEVIRVGVSGGTPAGDSNTYVLFDSTVTFGVGIAGDSRNATLTAHDISRIQFTLTNSQAGTLLGYWSQNKGTTWTVYDSRAVAIPAANAISGPYDYLVDSFPDFKLAWTNGGVAQATWLPSLLLIRGDRASGT